jgi:Asp-tRNA(Asn)/Glu-tRNA(Gln) amidotransferase A subunit family amidase
VKGLRIAFSPNLDGLRVDPDVATLVAGAARALESAGATIEELKKTGFSDTNDMIRLMWGCHYIGNYGQYLDGVARPDGPGPRRLHGRGEALDGAGVRRHARPAHRLLGQRAPALRALRPAAHAHRVGVAVRRRQAESRRVAAARLGLVSVGVVLLPVQLHGPAGGDGAGRADALGAAGGLQIVGRRFAETTVLQAAAAFEQIQPWGARRPRVS